jgi:hypothetical protein
MYGPIKLLSRLILLDEGLVQGRESLCESAYLLLNLVLLDLILGYLVVEVVPTRSDVLDVASEL